jgi:hypothetical protein
MLCLLALYWLNLGKHSLTMRPQGSSAAACVDAGCVTGNNFVCSGSSLLQQLAAFSNPSNPALLPVLHNRCVC